MALRVFSTSVDTLDQTFQRIPCIEAGGPRVAVDVALRITRALRRMRELLLQEREVGGDFHERLRGLPAKGTGLQGGEEGVEFGEVGALAGLLAFDGFGDGGETPSGGRRRWNKDLYRVDPTS